MIEPLVRKRDAYIKVRVDLIPVRKDYRVFGRGAWLTAAQGENVFTWGPGAGSLSRGW